MPRVVEAHVRQILPTSTQLTRPQVLASIASATLVVDKLSSRYSFNEALLQEIERNLAAHFCASIEPTLSLKSEKDSCSDSELTYGVSYGKGILSSTYGQTANTLSEGALAQLDKKPLSLKSIGSIEYIQT